MKNSLKGYIAAFVAVLAFSNVFIFSKAALQEVSLPQFGFYWFLLAVVLNFVLFFYRKMHRTFALLCKQSRWVLVMVGIIEIFGASLFFLSISLVDNPAVVSFLGNVGPVFVGVMGYVVLKERFNRYEIIGLLITLAGAVIISYNPEISLSAVEVSGLWAVLAATFISAFGTILVKRNVDKIPPLVLATNRTLFLFVAYVIWLVVSGQTLVVPTTALFNIAIGSILGPFLGISATYYALKHLEASRAAFIGSTKSLFVLVGAYVYFDKLPLNYQLIGGLVTIIGIVLITLGKRLKSMKRTSKVAKIEGSGPPSSGGRV